MADGWIRDEESEERIRQRSEQSTAAQHSSQPAARLLSFYEYHDDERLTCPQCGWTGLAREASRELHPELFDLSCPSCDKMLMVVSHPTIDETKEQAAAGNQAARAALPSAVQIEARWKRAEELALSSHSELPELTDQELRFSWDLETVEDEHWTVIKLGEQTVWRELAYWEGWRRFNAVKDLLKVHYGNRFVSLDPTERSELYLYGDDMSANIEPS